MSIRTPSGLNVLKRFCGGYVGVGSTLGFFQGGGGEACARVEEGLDCSWISVMGATLESSC